VEKIHCELGGEAANASKALKRAGFTDVANAGGLERVRRLQKEVHEKPAPLSRLPPPAPAPLQIDHARDIERLAALDLATVRAVKHTPKDPVERYHTTHALGRLPLFRQRDLSADCGSELVDKMIDAMEEVEAEPGVVLCQQVGRKARYFG
jgi:hypothetical protein